jgi:hypothetical protein
LVEPARAWESLAFRRSGGPESAGSNPAALIFRRTRGERCLESNAASLAHRNRGRGVAAARRTFNPTGGGSNPSDPIGRGGRPRPVAQRPEHPADNRATEVRPLPGRLAERFGSQVLAAAFPALNREVRVRAPRVPLGSRLATVNRHWWSSGEDSAPVMRRRGFESHPVLSAFFDNSGSATCARDVAAAYRSATAEARVRLPPGTSSLSRRSGRGKAWQSAWFGTRRAPVQIRPPRLMGRAGVCVSHTPGKHELVHAPPC